RVIVLRIWNNKKKGLRGDKPHAVLVWLAFTSPCKNCDKPMKFTVRVKGSWGRLVPAISMGLARELTIEHDSLFFTVRYLSIHYRLF
ncbi:MAG TPA: hypothetical protein VLH94_04325, partial [Spirochaetia bacterium]|nr:hypothetical protein [Spirochaetia bacterium]